MRWNIKKSKRVGVNDVITEDYVSLCRCLLWTFKFVTGEIIKVFIKAQTLGHPVPYKLRRNHSPHNGMDSRQCDVGNGTLSNCVPDSPDCRSHSDTTKLVSRVQLTRAVYRAESWDHFFSKNRDVTSLPCNTLESVQCFPRRLSAADQFHHHSVTFEAVIA